MRKQFEYIPISQNKLYLIRENLRRLPFDPAVGELVELQGETQAESVSRLRSELLWFLHSFKT